MGGPTADVIVVGLGAIGSAALHQLSARGLSAIGIDRFDVPNAEGSSHGGGRVIRAAPWDEPRCVPLALRAYELWHELEQAVRETLFTRTGGVHIAAPDHPLLRAVERATQLHGQPCERLDAATLRSRFPMFRPDDDAVGLLRADTGVLAPERCVAAHAISAVRHGAAIHGRERATAIESRDGAVTVTTDRDRYQCGAVVVATGAWLAAPDAPAPPPVPMEVERQVQCWFQPRQPELCDVGAMPAFTQVDGDAVFCGIPRVDHPGVEVRRHHGGAITTAEELAREPTRADERIVRSFVQARLPAADGPLVAARVGMYSNASDRRFVVGRHPERFGVFVAGGFSGYGFELAPAIGEVLASLVSDGATEHDLGPFDPSRGQV